MQARPLLRQASGALERRATQDPCNFGRVRRLLDADDAWLPSFVPSKCRAPGGSGGGCALCGHEVHRTDPLPGVLSCPSARRAGTTRGVIVGTTCNVPLSGPWCDGQTCARVSSTRRCDAGRFRYVAADGPSGSRFAFTNTVLGLHRIHESNLSGPVLISWSGATRLHKTIATLTLTVRTDDGRARIEDLDRICARWVGKEPYEEPIRRCPRGADAGVRRVRRVEDSGGDSGLAAGAAADALRLCRARRKRRELTEVEGQRSVPQARGIAVDGG